MADGQQQPAEQTAPEATKDIESGKGAPEKRRRCTCNKLNCMTWCLICTGIFLGAMLGALGNKAVREQLFPSAEAKMLKGLFPATSAPIVHVTANFPPACNTKMPADFLWGASSAAFQVEGSLELEGRAPSIWDTYQERPGAVADRSDASVAADQYKRYYEDIQLMKQYGIKAYRFSISWSRVIPGGTADSPVNPRALAHYSNLTDTLLAAGITPVVTLYHWDLPAALDDDTVYGDTPGWLNPEMPVHFMRYASVVFQALKGRVQHWITINEPWMVCSGGYAGDLNAPGRNLNPYACGRVLLAAHARAVAAFRQDKIGGKIGIAVNGDMVQPMYARALNDIKGTQRLLESSIGWFLDPIFKGAYPKIMVERLGSDNMILLPSEAAAIKGSADFIAINHFTTRWATKSTYQGPGNPMGMSVTQYNYKGKAIGETTGASWLMSVPWGLRSVLHWLSKQYNSPEIWITENGVPLPQVNATDILEAQVNDGNRTQYHKDYLQAMCQSVNLDRVKVKGYFVKTFVDGFEWKAGYSQKYGLVYLNGSSLTRVPRKSAEWYRDFINSQK